jgi:fluoroquinolone transport system ATP-binding protein
MAESAIILLLVEPVIDVCDLRFTYPGARTPAVDGMRFAVQRGEVFGFLGPSGAGKSTTQRVLIGLLRGYEGQVRVFGRDRAAWGADLYERIGVSFELPAHYQKLTAMENLRLFASLYAGPVADPDKLLARLGLAAHANSRVASFSKGMQMRLNLARALLHEPDLLFLDEPTTGQDPANARTIRQLVREQRAQGRTVFLTTHDMAVADELCDRVAFVVDGRIARIGEPKGLRMEHGDRRVRVEHRAGPGLASTEFPLAGLADRGDFLDLLRGGEVETIHTTEPALEDVFLDVTGRSLR